MNNTQSTESFNKVHKNVTGSTLKIIAIVTMLIDHTAAVLLHNNMIMRAIGRIAFPIFIFLLIEGAIHTKSKLKYALRLSLFALLSEIPFDLAFNGGAFYFGYQNVFFTLAIGMFMIIGFDLVEQNKIPALIKKILFALGLFAPAATILFLYGNVFLNMKKNFDLTRNLSLNFIYISMFVIIFLLTILYLFLTKSKLGKEALFSSSIDLLFLSLGVVVAMLLKTDYSAMGILAIATMYLLRNRKTESFLFGCLILILFQPFELPALIGLIPVSKYNGERGLKLKYIFYIFYPAHLLLIYGISLLLI